MVQTESKRKEVYLLYTESKMAMGKQAILPINYHSIQQPLNLKQLILLFDKILVEEQSLGLARVFVTHVSAQGQIDLSNYQFNNQNIDFLANEGLLAFETINTPITVSIGTPEANFMEQAAKEWQGVNDTVKNLKTALDKGSSLLNLMHIIRQLPASFARALSIRLQNEGIEAYPVFEEEPDYSQAGKKEQVFKFVLAQIPQPDNAVSWEQIIDFRKDPDTMKKYYALIKWVNDVAKKGSTSSEIEDEYEFLYHDYSEQYRIHRMKSKRSIIEILVTAAMDVISSHLGFGTIRTSLFSLWKEDINLLESESKFTGREVAYTHKVEQKFNPTS